jgi:hypothetical protein
MTRFCYRHSAARGANARRRTKKSQQVLGKLALAAVASDIDPKIVGLRWQEDRLASTAPIRCATW